MLAVASFDLPGASTDLVKAVEYRAGASSHEEEGLRERKIGQRLLGLPLLLVVGGPRMERRPALGL